MKHPESDLQKAIINHLRTRSKPDVIFYSSTQGIKMTAITAITMKRLGMRSGIPDLELLIKDKIYFLEIKSVKGKLSPEQQAFELHCNKWGIPYFVVRDIKTALQLLEGWGALKGKSV